MKFKVEVRRIRTDFVTIDVEANSYVDASREGLRQAELAGNCANWIRKHIPDEYRTNSTDIVHEAGCECGWTTCPAKEQP